MKTTILAMSASLLAILPNGFAEPDFSRGSTVWCSWTSPNVGVSTNFYANHGTFAVAEGGEGIFGKGAGELTFTSNNPDPVAEHQFGNSSWGPAKPPGLIDVSSLAGKNGLEILVNVDPASTSDKICIKLGTAAPDEVYSQTVAVEKGSSQRVQFPLSGFKNSKNPESALEDFTTLNGTVQLTDGWKGYPKPAQGEWKCKFSDIRTY